MQRTWCTRRAVGPLVHLAARCSLPAVAALQLTLPCAAAASPLVLSCLRVPKPVPTCLQVLSSYDGSLLDEFTLTKPPGWRFEPRPAALGSGSGGGSSGAWGRLLGGRRGDGAAVA